MAAVRARVRAREEEPFENTYRRFRRYVEKENVLGEVRRRAHHLKKCTMRKLKAKAAVKRELKRRLRDQQSNSRDRKRYDVVPTQYVTQAVEED